MKLPCELVRDLLPLYHDGVCGETSKTLVEAHLKECPDCAKALTAIEAEIAVPPLEEEKAKPLKKLKRVWTWKTWLRGILGGLLSIFFWFQLTQTCSVKIAPKEYEVTQAYRFSNGMYYLEFQLPYDSISAGICADVLRTDEGVVSVNYYRPRISVGSMTESYIIDPANYRSDEGVEGTLKAFYLGDPDSEDALLLWSSDMDIPQATPEQEEELLYRYIFH